MPKGGKKKEMSKHYTEPKAKKIYVAYDTEDADDLLAFKAKYS